MAKRIKQEIIFEVFENIQELSEQQKTLVQKAIAASKQAYAPYSKFSVGAAVLLEDGEIIIGNNQENAVYPTGLCAERVALFSASANFPSSKVEAIAIVATNSNDKIILPASPCGGCRQAISEYESKHDKPIEIIMSAGNEKFYIADSIEHLLPLRFTADDLPKQ